MEERCLWAIMRDIGCMEGFLVKRLGGLGRDVGVKRVGVLEVFECGGVWCGGG